MITSFTNTKINIVGPTGAHRDLSFNSSETMNFILEANPSGPNLSPWPGSDNYLSITATTPRGLHEFSGIGYKISDETLYSFLDDGSPAVDLGTIPGSGRCVMRDNGSVLIITTGIQWFQWDGVSLIEFFPPAGFTQGNSVDFLSKFAIYDLNDGNYGVSDFGDPDVVQSLNVAQAESSPDDLKRIYVFNENAYLMGNLTIETHYLDGTTNPPIRKANGGTMPIGLKDIHSVANSTNFVYFRGSDGYVYRFSSTQAVNITSGAAANAFETYADDTANGYVIKIQGGTYYVITFTANNATWVFSEKSGDLAPGVNDWFQISTGADMDRYIGDFYIKAFNKHLLEKKESGDIIQLDLDLFSDDREQIVRIRELPPIHGGLLSENGEGQRLEMSWLTIKGKKGVGLPSGVGVDPRVFFQISLDGGDSFTHDMQVHLGRTGESIRKLTWYFTASFYEATIRIKYFDPVFASLHSASIGIKFIGD